MKFTLSERIVVALLCVLVYSYMATANDLQNHKLKHSRFMNKKNQNNLIYVQVYAFSINSLLFLLWQPIIIMMNNKKK